MVHVVTRVPLNTLRKGTAFLGCGAPPYILGVRLFNARSVRCSAGWVPGEKGTTMSERTPKLPLNNPEYTVPEYSVLLPSNEPESSTVEGDGTSNNTATNNAAPTGAVDNNAAEDNAPSNGAPEHATTGYRDATAGYVAASEHAGWVRPKALRSAKRCTTAIIILSLFTTIQLFLLFGKPIAGVETLPDLVVRMLGYPLLFVLIQICLFWMTWKGHRWAHILTLMYSAYEVLSRMYWFAQDFLVDSRYITLLMDELQSSDSADFAVAFLIRTAIGVFITVLYVRNIVLLTRPSVWAYTATGRTSHSQVVDQNPQAPNTNFNEGGNRLN
ncbi:hypothetical protein HMPREF2971_03250 [Rothia sp. HMSC066G07]|uniref:Uncharacterized protein n=2 Tax=Rothia TaxID=32207 RepID=A0A930LUW2_9MICC|nr:hypothetical protein [Rothia mucilaginosa]OFP75991.1 hypothetical protein HMPREF2971_03250 [Rothia sp. HMSC066G07]